MPSRSTLSWRRRSSSRRRLVTGREVTSADRSSRSSTASAAKRARSIALRCACAAPPVLTRNVIATAASASPSAVKNTKRTISLGGFSAARVERSGRIVVLGERGKGDGRRGSGNGSGNLGHGERGHANFDALAGDDDLD